jgi:hypothetical protein
MKDLRWRKLHNPGPQAPTRSSFTSLHFEQILKKTVYHNLLRMINTMEQAYNKWIDNGMVNYHSAADHYGSKAARNRWQQIFSHFESSLWSGYKSIRGIISLHQTCSTLSTPLLVWSLFPSEIRYHYGQSANISSLQAASGHKSTYCSVPLTMQAGWESAAMRPLHSTLKIKAAKSAETLVSYHRSVWCQPRWLWPESSEQ